MYYVMTCPGEYPRTLIETSPKLPGGPWFRGQKLIIEVPTPLKYTLNANYPGKLCAMYEEARPIASNQLLTALGEAGVDNLELFDAELHDPLHQKVFHNYKAFNIVGLVACADMNQSKLMGTSPPTMLATDFDSLYIDETKTGGAYLFRLAENCSAIVVHEKIKLAIQEKGIKGMKFYGPGEWSG